MLFSCKHSYPSLLFGGKATGVAITFNLCRAVSEKQVFKLPLSDFQFFAVAKVT
jgi:hypothetical protein